MNRLQQAQIVLTDNWHTPSDDLFNEVSVVRFPLL
jgi:hypothetical protein